VGNKNKIKIKKGVSFRAAINAVVRKQDARNLSIDQPKPSYVPHIIKETVAIARGEKSFRHGKPFTVKAERRKRRFLIIYLRLSASSVDFRKRKNRRELGLGVTRKTFSELINCKSGVSIPMALKLSKAFNTTPEYWLNMQQNFDLWRAKKNVHLGSVKVLFKKQRI